MGGGTPDAVVATVAVHANDGTLVATVTGDVDELTVSTIAARVEDEARAAAAADLVIDLRPVTFIGSAGLSMLLGVRQDLGPRPVRLVVNPASMTARLLRITELGSVFPLHRQLDEALVAARAERDGSS